MTTASQTALSIIFKERIRDMPNNLDDKEILAYAKIIKNCGFTVKFTDFKV